MINKNPVRWFGTTRPRNHLPGDYWRDEDGREVILGETEADDQIRVP